MKPVRLTKDTEILPFDCGHPELNGFLFDDAKAHATELIATTFLLVNESETIAYWSYLNDKITVNDIGNMDKFKSRISYCFSKEIKEKEYKSYPAVKMGRLAVNHNYNNIGIGKLILGYTKQLFITSNRTGCRFITVDAFKCASDFYIKNGFSFVSGKDRNSDTRQMYFDLMTLIQ